MWLKTLILLLALTALSVSFARYCQIFSPGFKQCSVCVRGFYAVEGLCIQCPAARNTIRECSTPSSSNTVARATQDSTNGSTGNASSQTSGSSGAVDVSNSTNQSHGTSNQSNGTSNQSNNATNVSNGASNTSNTSTNNITNNSSSTTTNNTNNSSTSSNNTTTSNATNVPNTTNTSNATHPTNKSSDSNTNTTSDTPPQQNRQPSPPMSDLAQIISKYIPTNCRQFVLTPLLECRSCEKGFLLTNNNTCEQEKPPIPAPNPAPTPVQDKTEQIIPATLKVSSSLPAETALPIVINQPIPQSTPQPILVPIPTNNKNQAAAAVNNTSSLPPLKDTNCFTPNLSFDPRLPAIPSNSPCQACFKFYFFNFTAQRCMPVNPLCQTVTSQNECRSCYPGYQLNDAKCVIASGQITINPVNPGASYTPTVAPDPNCQKYFLNSARCDVCANRYYFDTNRAVCVSVDSSCQTWNSNGFCTSCYAGFRAGQNDRVCRPSPKEDASKCLRKTNGKCTSCAFRSYLREGACLQVSDLCSTFNPTNGDCLTCYNGYLLYGNTCGRIVPNCITSSVLGCSTCIDGYFPNKKGYCQPVSLLCNGYNPQNGFCVDCIFPYTLDPSSGECLYLP